MAIKPQLCEAILEIGPVAAKVRCSFVGTDRTMPAHIQRGEHKSMIDQTSGSSHFQIKWWTVTSVR